MRVGDSVNYFDQADQQHDATITEVSGTGESWYKILNVSYRKDGEDVFVEKVPHENDAKPGEAFWLEKGQRRKEPKEGTPTEPVRKSKK